MKSILIFLLSTLVCCGHTARGEKNDLIAESTAYKQAKSAGNLTVPNYTPLSLAINGLFDGNSITGVGCLKDSEVTGTFPEGGICEVDPVSCEIQIIELDQLTHICSGFNPQMELTVQLTNVAPGSVLDLEVVYDYELDTEFHSFPIPDGAEELVLPFPLYSFGLFVDIILSIENADLSCSTAINIGYPIADCIPDCNGEFTGSAYPGTPCTTADDTDGFWTEDCICVNPCTIELTNSSSPSNSCVDDYPTYFFTFDMENVQPGSTLSLVATYEAFLEPDELTLLLSGEEDILVVPMVLAAFGTQGELAYEISFEGNTCGGIVHFAVPIADCFFDCNGELDGPAVFGSPCTSEGGEEGTWDASCTCELDPEICFAFAGEIATGNNTQLCAGESEPLIVFFIAEPNNSPVFTTAIIITTADPDPLIRDIYTVPTQIGAGVSFDGYTGNNFQIWALNATSGEAIDNLMIAMDNGATPPLSSLGDELCFELSNPIAVNLITCMEPVPGCTNPNALNYNPAATEDDGSCGFATALGCYAESVLEYVEGTQLNGSPVWADRTDPTKALGEPDRVNAPGGFVSLGYGGSISLAFSGQVTDQPGDDILVWETSYASDDCLSDGIEAAHIELSQDGIIWVAAGTLCRDGAVDIAVTGFPWVAYIKIINDAASTTFDGYDVDGVEAINGCDEFEPSEECYGTYIYVYNPGPQNDGSPITDPERLDPTKALGAPQLDETFNFVSLGYGGELIIGFEGDVLNGPGADILVSETTFGNNTFATYPESADVYVSQNNIDFFLVGSMQTSQVGLFDISDAGQGFTYIVAVKVVDTTPVGSESTDGFDVDAVEALNGCEQFIDIFLGDCYAQNVVDYVQGSTSNGGAIAVNRIDPNQALGEPEGTDELVFVALGYGGSITIDFGASVPNGPGADLEIVETTYNFSTCENYPEYADVYVSQDGIDFFYAGTVCHADNLIDIEDAGQGFDFIYLVKIVNNDLLTTSPDGFDVDGVRAIHNCIDEEGDQYGTVAPADADKITTSTHQLINSSLRSQPNPTNGPSVAIFTVVETAPTTLEVFDMNGRNVSTLFNQVANEGQEYRIDFEGTFLPNGVYIYRLTTGSEVVVEKFMIAR